MTLGVHCPPVPAGGRRHGLSVPRKVLRSQRFELCGELGESVRQPADVRAGRTTRPVAIRGVSVELSAVSRPCRLRTPRPRPSSTPRRPARNGRPPAMRSTANGCRRQGRQRGRAAAPPVPFSAGFLSGSVSLHGLCPIDRPREPARHRNLPSSATAQTLPCRHSPAFVSATPRSSCTP